MKHVDEDGQVAWIAEHADIESDYVRQVLALEFEYMVGVGILTGLNDFAFRFYEPAELRGASQVVDTDRLARDAEERLGIPKEMADEVFEHELEFLKMRGLVADSERESIQGEGLLEQHKQQHCWEKTDRVSGDAEMTLFRRRARLHQSLWRSQRGYAMGGHHQKNGERRPIGSRLELKAAREQGLNFLSEPARQAVAARLSAPQPHQMINEERLWTDLLSSMPLCFNLFGDLWADPALATRVLNSWGLNLPGDVEEVIFEWSPGRLDRDYLNNKSAFDAAFMIKLPSGERGVLGVETKYHEVALSEKAPKGSKLLRYAEISENSRAFTEQWPELPIGSDVQQLWLDHLLALSMRQHPTDRWSWVQFLLIYPEGNVSFARAADRYSDALRDDEGFRTLTLERVLETDAIPDALRNDLRDRYLWNN